VTFGLEELFERDDVCFGGGFLLLLVGVEDEAWGQGMAVFAVLAVWAGSKRVEGARWGKGMKMGAQGDEEVEGMRDEAERRVEKEKKDRVMKVVR
jgi:hypothetical protein